METIHRIVSNEGEFVGAFRQDVIRVIGSYGQSKEPDEYDAKIREKQEEMVALIAENAKAGSYSEAFDKRYQQIVEEINVLKDEQMEVKRKERLEENYEQRIKDMDNFIQNITYKIPEFDNDLVRRLIKTIKVVSADKLMIQFQSGICMEQNISYD
ncbi:Site-specific recombinase [Anaeromicropila populeti]|uniref:Site-specific DNA recombinase n=1 Tax=Anaeromicropila populeti TaxID=37658 RepID=A0A1I6JHK5_9FIRM|nr:Site-specific recombinase [Anaeromicropila populeti]SFR78090.1 site-specific DNA recombinase [Anaeromicropila populeti]